MLISEKKKLIYLLCTKTNKLPSYFVYSLFQSMRKSPSSLPLSFALHVLRTVKFFPGKTSAARILGTRNQCSAMEAMIINCKWGKLIQFVVTTTRKMDYSIGATLGNVLFLVLWHFWTNLASKIAVNRWNVDHVGFKYFTGKFRDRSLFMQMGKGKKKGGQGYFRLARGGGGAKLVYKKVQEGSSSIARYILGVVRWPRCTCETVMLNCTICTMLILLLFVYLKHHYFQGNFC